MNATVSKVMRANPSKGTGPEKTMAWMMSRLGMRYEQHSKDLPGKPDFVFREDKIAVFVHGCFWHHHGKHHFKMPKHNRAFWKRKFEANAKRDKRDRRELRKMGWRVITLWECDVKKDPFMAVARVLSAIIEPLVKKAGEGP